MSTENDVIDALRTSIREAADTLTNHYPDVGGGALMAAVAVQCEQLAALVPPTEPHQWFTLGMGADYCFDCGVYRPTPAAAATPHYPYSTRVTIAGDVKQEANHTSHAAIDLQHRPVHLRKGDQVSVRDAAVQDTDGNSWFPVELSFPEQFIHGWFLKGRLAPAKT